jgi:hypothetical protein
MLAFAAEFDRRLYRIGTAKSASRHLIDCWREVRFVGTGDFSPKGWELRRIAVVDESRTVRRSVRDDHYCSVLFLRPLKVFLEPFQRGLAPHRVQGAILRARHGHASFRPDKGEEPAEHTLATGKRLYGPDRE